MMKNKKVYALAGVAALALVGGTFAYYNASQTFQNPFNTTNYGTQSTEKFNPSDGDNWKPGAEVDKEVYATNTGKGEVWVRVSFDEAWNRGDDKFGVFDSKSLGQFNPADGITAGDHQSWDESVNPRVHDGDVSNDTGSVVYKNFAEDYTDFWIYNEEDGYYYYKSSLAEGESTKKLLDSVILCGDADMGKFENNTYYLVLDDEPEEVPVYPNGGDWIKLGEDEKLDPKSEALKDKYVYTYKENKLIDELQGYANAGYELNINVEFVQADEDAEAALASGWKWTPLAGNDPSI